MKKFYKRILLAGVLLIVFAAVAVNLMAPMKVAGLKIKTETYRDSIKEEGTLQAQRKWNLFAPQSLTVKKIHVKEGDSVKAGTLLVQLDDRLLSRQWAANQNAIDLQILALQGELASAGLQKAQYSKKMIDQTIQGINLQIDTQTKELESAQKHYENMQILFEEGYISQSELDEAQQATLQLYNSVAALKVSAALQTEQMQTSWDYYSSLENTLQERISTLQRLSKEGITDAQSAQLAFYAEQTSLYCPHDGIVLSVKVKEEELADPTEPAVTIYETGSVGAQVYLVPSDAALIFPGMEANVIIEEKGQKERILTAVVTGVSPYAEEIVSKLGLSESRVKVSLSLNESNNVIIGQKADIEFVLASKEKAVAVPKTAVFEYKEGLAVMTQSDGKARLVMVVEDFETDTMVIIRSGLSEGDVVLLNPTQEGLKEGKGISVDLQ